MKQGWTYKKLGEVCEIFGRIGFRGYTKGDLVNSPEEGAITLSPSNIVNGEMDYSKCSYITWAKYEESPEIMIFPGDILVVKTASVGKTALVKELPHKATINPQFVVLKKIQTNNEYLSYYLKSETAQKFIWSIAKGAAAQTVSQKNLAEMKIPVPSLSEQQRIVERLDAAFAHIDELKANAEKQLSEARTLFQKALTKAMEPKEGWEEKTLKEIGLTQTGTTPSKNDKENYGDYIPFIRPSEIDCDGCGNIDYNSEIKLSEKGLSNGRLFKSHSILMVCIGTIGKIGFSTMDVSCNQQINVLTPKEDNDYKFVYYAMRNSAFNDNVIKIAKSAQATLPIINKGKWELLTLFIPPLPEQQRIVARLDSLSENVRKYEEIQQKVIAECDALKQALLRKVFV